MDEVEFREFMGNSRSEPLSRGNEPVTPLRWGCNEPVTPLHWGCRCIRGPSWDEAGHGDQDGPRINFGVVLPPEAKDLREWLMGILYGIHGGHCVDGLYDGGWWWDRSVKCFWPDVDDWFYYRAGDSGAFDLATAEPWVPNPHDFMRKVWKVRDIIFNLLDKADAMTLKIPDYAEEKRHKPLQIQYLRQTTGAFADLMITRICLKVISPVYKAPHIPSSSVNMAKSTDDDVPAPRSTPNVKNGQKNTSKLDVKKKVKKSKLIRK